MPITKKAKNEKHQKRSAWLKLSIDSTVDLTGNFSNLISDTITRYKFVSIINTIY